MVWLVIGRTAIVRRVRLKKCQDFWCLRQALIRNTKSQTRLLGTYILRRKEVSRTKAL
jgi:hypothetical protein